MSKPSLETQRAAIHAYLVALDAEAMQTVDQIWIVLPLDEALAATESTRRDLRRRREAALKLLHALDSPAPPSKRLPRSSLSST
ncbi:unnamed protein product [Peniophora sp. CBMAI 1063]|nr:unnamed protein product [Peniophora sp. CBMAI 1063]